ncbi:DUF1573 domain-containing protein [Halosquirtibacter laminarini]|uniref:DUF1573 domain-containing protein n=1 Tax=Halosquirtibacter laminarini TaxID=3374600 RepID=A0AC61NIM8_9BACT|nr:DUF1573 domain-containing protein [Prolixibacteraceae bacterium]
MQKNVFSLAVIMFSVTIGVIVYVYYSSMSCSVTLTTEIQFGQDFVDMGDLKQGIPRSVEFRCKNTGSEPLVIKYVESSCGCAKPEWTKHPILPNKTGLIKVTYDAKYPGSFTKTIMVFCNSEKGMEKLKIRGRVIPSDI